MKWPDVDVISASLIEIGIPLKFSFATGHGTIRHRRTLLVRLETSAGEGVAECVALPEPGYSPETVDTSWEALTGRLLPALVGRRVGTPAEIRPWLDTFPDCRMAAAAVECALWDAYCRSLGQGLSQVIGGVRSETPAGVVVGIQPDTRRLIEKVEKEIADGYRRVKLKIMPGWDRKPVEAVREAFPSLDLAVDANGSYTLAEADALEALDAFGLSYIEQPLPAADLEGHAELQARLMSPICLDESIDSVARCRRALEIGAARVINIKIGRLGGIIPALEAHDLAVRHGAPVWCGGMLETGLGRAFNLALSALPNFTLPGDISSSSRYFERDIVIEPLEAIDGVMKLPDGPGSGVTVDWEFVSHLTHRKKSFH